MKIGELLVSKQLISWVQLEEALDAKRYYGGRLGENLVEMGFIAEAELAKCLSEQLEIPYVRPEEVAAIPALIIEKLPRALAEKYRVVPLRLRGPSELEIAISDPSRIDTIDMLGFSLGLRLKPHIITEVTLNYALERYYGIPRPVRLLSVPGRERGARTPDSPPGPPSQAEEEDAVRELQSLDTAPPPPKVAPAPRPGAPAPRPAAAPVPSAGPAHAVVPAAAPRAAVRVEQARLEALADARTDEDIVITLTEYLATFFERVVIGAFGSNAVTAVTAAGVAVTPEELAAISVPLSQWSLLHEASISPRVIHEDTLNDAALQQLCKAAHLLPAFITVIPIHELRRASHVAICQGRDLDFVREHLVEMKSFVHKVSCALQILTLRGEILTGE